MSKETQKKIAYWFFLLAGIIGITIQIYKYVNNDLELSFANGIVTTVFSMFILRPTILIDAFKMIINKIGNIKTNAN